MTRRGSQQTSPTERRPPKVAWGVTGGLAKPFFGAWRNFEKISRAMGGQSTVVESRSGFRYGERGGGFQETAPTERRPPNGAGDFGACGGCYR
jgi:hypothetical protein